MSRNFQPIDYSQMSTAYFHSFRHYFHTCIFLLCCYVFFVSAVFAQGDVPGGFYGLSNSDNTEKVTEMNFSKDAAGWENESERNGRMIARDGVLSVEALNGTPMIYREYDLPCEHIKMRFRIRTKTESDLVLYWITKGSPRRGEDKSVRTKLTADNQWHTYELDVPVNGHLLNISIKLDSKFGTWAFESIESTEKISRPLVISGLANDKGDVVFTVENRTEGAIKFTADHGEGAKNHSLAPRGKGEIRVPLKPQGNLSRVRLVLSPEGGVPVVYSLFKYHPEGETVWIRASLGTGDDTLIFEIAPDAKMARVRKDEKILAIIAPIVHREGMIPEFTRDTTARDSLVFKSKEAELKVRLLGTELEFSIKDLVKNSPGLFEGPVVRLLGPLRGGLLSGVEYLGPGDVGSSDIDIESPYNTRFSPPPSWITMPLAVLKGEEISIGMMWNDMKLQPVFASPNFIDAEPDHRVSLKGNEYQANIRFVKVESIPETIEWFVERRGFPKPNPAPRTPDEQKQLSLKAFQGPVRGEDKLSWSYGAEEQWPRRPYADYLSCVWRLTGRLPRISSVQPGGSVIPDEAVYFGSERLKEWQEMKYKQVQAVIDEMRSDGSFPYRTRFQEQEPNAEIAPGYAAKQVMELLEFVRISGDKRVFAQAEKALQKLKEYEIPRGGRYWESPLHTPDLLSAAYLCWAFTRAYEFSGNEEYLSEARRWAFSGLPFVYQWAEPEKPIMLYAAVPMFGGTGRKNPGWFGNSQPWTGLTYAYAIHLLSKHDEKIRWADLARGMLHTVEQMQETEEPFAGCFPEAFSIDLQQRRSYHLNPCPMVNLRAALEGELEGVYVATGGNDRIASPYPVVLDREGVLIDGAPSGQRFQILHNGQDVISVQGSGGKNRVPL